MRYVVELPWGMRYPGVKYLKDKKVHVWEGDALPPALKEFQAEPFSYESFVQAELNKGKMMSPPVSKTLFTPRPHQVNGAKVIFQSWQNNWSEFLLSDATGVGKTLTSLVAIAAIEKKLGRTPKAKGNVLIVCPKSVIPSWRNTLKSYPASTSVAHFMVINYQRLNKLLKAPATAKKAKKTKTKNRQSARNGKPYIHFDVVVFDEGHYLKNYPMSLMSLAASNVARMNEDYKRGYSPFVIYSTATPGSSPLHLSLLSRSLSRLLGANPIVAPKQWGSFLCQSGFAVKKGKTGYSWITVPWGHSDDKTAIKKVQDKQRKDALRIGKALQMKGAPFLKRLPKDIAGWPEQQVIGFPLQLSQGQLPVYQEVWTRFRQWLKMNPKGSNPKGALVERLRYRQKASLLKVPHVVDVVLDWLEQDYQIFISFEFLESLENVQKKLNAQGIKTAVITGQTPDREKERLRFQKGEAKVVLVTPVAGISFHAKETLPDGSKATSNPRITVLFDVRQNPLDNTQALGRCHRDGENSVVYIPFFNGTVEEKVVQAFINNDTNMKTMTGSQDFLDDVYYEEDEEQDKRIKE